MNKISKVKNSGKKRDFGTGAVRDNGEGKGRYDLIPEYPISRLALIFERGAKHYGERNWEKGIKLHSFLDSAKRHLSKFSEGYVDEDHLMQAVWNLICLCNTERMIELGFLPKHLDDLYKPLLQKRANIKKEKIQK